MSILVAWEFIKIIWNDCYNYINNNWNSKCRIFLMKLSTVKSTRMIRTSTDTYFYPSTSLSKCQTAGSCWSMSGVLWVFNNLEGGFITKFTLLSPSSYFLDALKKQMLRQEWFQSAIPCTRSTKQCFRTQITIEKLKVTSCKSEGSC